MSAQYLGYHSTGKVIGLMKGSCSKGHIGKQPSGSPFTNLLAVAGTAFTFAACITAADAGISAGFALATDFTACSFPDGRSFAYGLNAQPTISVID